MISGSADAVLQGWKQARNMTGCLDMALGCSRDSPFALGGAYEALQTLPNTYKGGTSSCFLSWSVIEAKSSHAIPDGG